MTHSLGPNWIRLTKPAPLRTRTIFTRSTLAWPNQQQLRHTVRAAKKNQSQLPQGAGTLMASTASAKSLSRRPSRRQVLGHHALVTVSVMYRPELPPRQFQQSRSWRILRDSYKRKEICVSRWNRECTLCPPANETIFFTPV